MASEVPPRVSSLQIKLVQKSRSELPLSNLKKNGCKMTDLGLDWGLLFITAYSAPYAACGLQQDVRGMRMEIRRALLLMKCIHRAEFGRASCLGWLQTSSNSRLWKGTQMNLSAVWLNPGLKCKPLSLGTIISVQREWSESVMRERERDV